MQLSCLAVVVFLGAVYGNTVPLPTKEQLSNIIDHSRKAELINFVKDRCETVGGADSFDNIRDAAVGALDCLQEGIKKEITSIIDFCHAYNASCTQPLIEAVSVCLKPEEEYLKDFVTEIVDKQIHFICDNNMQKIRDIMTTSNMQCLEHISQDSGANACSAAILKKINDNVFGDFVFTKDKMCKVSNDYEACARALFTRNCPTNTALLAIMDESYSMYHDICADVKAP